MTAHNTLETKEEKFSSWTAETNDIYRIYPLESGHIAVLARRSKKIEIRSGIDGTLLVPPREIKNKDGKIFETEKLISSGGYIICINYKDFIILDAANLNFLGEGSGIYSYATSAITLPGSKTLFITDEFGKPRQFLELSMLSFPVIAKLPKKISDDGRSDSLAILQNGRIFILSNNTNEEITEEKSAPLRFDALEAKSLAQLVPLAKDHLAIVGWTNLNELVGYVYNAINQKLISVLKFVDGHAYGYFSEQARPFEVNTMFGHTVLALTDKDVIYFWELGTKKQYDVNFGMNAKVIGDKVVQQTGDHGQPTFIIYDALQLKNILLTVLKPHFPSDLSHMIVREYLPGFSFFSKDKKISDTPASVPVVAAPSFIS